MKNLIILMLGIMVNIPALYQIKINREGVKKNKILGIF